jgi:ribosomal protein S18 acetylase RimI-like enzyme
MVSQIEDSNDLHRMALDEFDPVRAILGRAFVDYNLMVYACANERRRLNATTILYAGMTWDCLMRGEVYTTADGAGVAAWLGPGTPISSFFQQARAGLLRLPVAFGLRGFMKLLAYDEVGRRLHHHYASGPHWYLAVIAVDPAQQGRGLGSQLLAPMLGRADDEKVLCWLETHKDENVRLYERHGFKVVERADVGGHPLPVYGMLRRPR